MAESTDQAIDTFFEHYLKSTNELITSFDPDWPSPCETGSFWLNDQDQKVVRWHPVRRVHGEKDAAGKEVGALVDAGDFDGLEHALEHAIHPDIKAHYGRYWSANLDADAPDGRINLLYLWNEADRDRLIENLIGHAVACRHNKTPFAVFFACTEDPDDFYLTVHNETGQVQLEQPGQKPIRTIADNLAHFYTMLVPAP